MDYMNYHVDRSKNINLCIDNLIKRYKAFNVLGKNVFEKI